MNRRLLFSAVGIAAAGAGAFWATRHGDGTRIIATAKLPGQEAGTGAAGAGAGSGAASAGSEAPLDLWSQRFDRPEGGELVLSSLRGKPLVLNFWATWCPPCVKEMPELDRFARDFSKQGWQVVGIAVDSPSPVRAFLKETPVSFPIGLAGFGGTELARSLGNAAGGLPFSVLLNSQGDVLERKLGATSYAELANWTQKV